jgi:predicted GNAT family acetyltransferase
MNDNSLESVFRRQFEISRDGHLSYLIYETDDKQWISLLYTMVAEPVRGRGIASELAHTAFEYAKAHNLKVDVVCPISYHFLLKHPEYRPLVVKRH